MARSWFPTSCPSPLQIFIEQHKKHNYRVGWFVFVKAKLISWIKLLMTHHAAFVPPPKPSSVLLPPSALLELGPPQWTPCNKKKQSRQQARKRVSHQVPFTAELHKKGKPKPTHHTKTWRASLFLIPSLQHHVPLAPASPSAPLSPLRCKVGGNSHRVSLNINKRDQVKDLFKLSSSIKWEEDGESGWENLTCKVRVVASLLPGPPACQKAHTFL